MNASDGEKLVPRHPEGVMGNLGKETVRLEMTDSVIMMFLKQFQQNSSDFNSFLQGCSDLALKVSGAAGSLLCARPRSSSLSEWPELAFPGASGLNQLLISVEERKAAALRAPRVGFEFPWSVGLICDWQDVSSGWNLKVVNFGVCRHSDRLLKFMCTTVAVDEIQEINTPSSR